jgi:hypothetical protein
MSRLVTSRELTLSLVLLALLGLTGSAGRVPADALPQTPPGPTQSRGLAAVPTPRPVRDSPVPTKPVAKSSPKVVPVPRVPIVGTAPRRPAPVRTNDHPAKLTVEGLDLALPVKAVGVTKKGEMEVPETIKEVGWYRFGAHPSSRTGTTVLAAHVDTRREGLGPFARLQEAKAGTRVVVTDSDGDRHPYKVADVTSMDKAKVPWRQVFAEGGHPRLVLITCGGAYDQESGYRDNVLVTAFPDS